jgi:hypothetical protein
MARALALDATNAYWITTETGGNTIWQIPKDFSAPGKAIAITTGTYGGVTSTGGTVYYTENNGGNPGFYYVGGDGGTSYQLGGFSVGDTATDIAADSGALYLTLQLAMANGLAIIFRYDLGTKSMMVLANGEPSPQGLALDATYLYWSTSSGIHRVVKTGGTVQTVGPSTIPVCGGLSVDPAYVYCTNNATSQVMQISLASNNVYMAMLAAPIRGIAADCSDVYVGAGTNLAYIARQ